MEWTFEFEVAAQGFGATGMDRGSVGGRGGRGGQEIASVERQRGRNFKLPQDHLRAANGRFGGENGW